jgi:hypothetical protein
MFNRASRIKVDELTTTCDANQPFPKACGIELLTALAITEIVLILWEHFRNPRTAPRTTAFCYLFLGSFLVFEKSGYTAFTGTIVPFRSIPLPRGPRRQRDSTTITRLT